MEENQEKQVKKFAPMPIGFILTMGFLFLLLGLIISTQFKDYIAIQRAGVPAYRQINELVSILKLTQNKKSDLEKQLSQVKHELKDMSKDNNNHSLSNQQLKKIYDIAGLTQIKGEGLVIKLKEPKSSKDNSLGNNDNLVHSDDLLNIVNELKSSGAKAISINNSRLVTTSEIITAGNNIIVNQSKLFPPYKIKVIGPVDTMYSALNLRGGVLENIEVYGIKVNIDKDSNIDIPPFKGNY